MSIPSSNASASSTSAGLAALESQCWAPWLRFSESDLAGQARIFPEGQLVVTAADGITPLGMMACNRVEWTGLVDELPTWDGVAGQPPTFENTYDPAGNSVVMMSISIQPSTRGRGIAHELISMIRAVVRRLDVERLIAPCRPSRFGSHRRLTGLTDFATYCELTRDDGWPIDPWLRALTRQGLAAMKIDPRAMVVPASHGDLADYQESSSLTWATVTDESLVRELITFHGVRGDLAHVDRVLDCGETGWWFLDDTRGEAVYVEANIWGELPLELPARS